MDGTEGGCMDQVFDLIKVCEMYVTRGSYVFWAFMDLQKAYDAIYFILYVRNMIYAMCRLSRM